MSFESEQLTDPQGIDGPPRGWRNGFDGNRVSKWPRRWQKDEHWCIRIYYGYGSKPNGYIPVPPTVVYFKRFWPNLRMKPSISTKLCRADPLLTLGCLNPCHRCLMCPRLRSCDPSFKSIFELLWPGIFFVHDCFKPLAWRKGLFRDDVYLF